MRPSWIEPREESLGRRLALAPLCPPAALLRLGASLDRALHRAAVLPVRRFPGRVVSVGNLSLGGNGKTPLAAWLARELSRRGRRVALVSRGYRRRGRGRDPVVVSDGCQRLASVAEAGDEPLVLAAHAPGVPVLVGRDRARVGEEARARFGAEWLVLDDGFQHHRLERDLDLIAVDAAQGFGNRFTLPRGSLRESPRALRFADAVGFVDGPPAPADDELVRRHAPDAHRFAARRRPTVLRPLRGGPALAPETLAGQEVGLLAGLARPDSLHRTLEALGARVVAERHFPDHHRYRPGDLLGLAAAAPRWVTTEKDAVKIDPAWATSLELGVLEIEIELDAPEALLSWIETNLGDSPQTNRTNLGDSPQTNLSRGAHGGRLREGRSV